MLSLADAGLPAPERLAAVATVLCLYPNRQRDALAGWSNSASAQRLFGEGADAAHEGLLFRDAQGRACWRLYLLPDSDFLAWDLAVGHLPAAARRGDADGWARLHGRIRRWLHGGWTAQALRLQLTCDEAGRRILVADGAALSPLGREHARRIAASERAPLRTTPDTCCCMARRAAAQAHARAAQPLASH